jgi:rod shape-determining protein MreC
VAEVEKSFSLVLMLSDGSSSVNALTQDSRVNGAVKGSLGLGMTMEMIPIDAALNAGETVLTSGLNDNIPRGLVIGRLAEVVKKANEIWQSAVVVPAADLNELEQVFVIRN